MVELDRFAARGMVRGMHLGCVLCFECRPVITQDHPGRAENKHCGNAPSRAGTGTVTGPQERMWSALRCPSEFSSISDIPFEGDEALGQHVLGE
jgi:hypothetical protein